MSTDILKRSINELYKHIISNPNDGFEELKVYKNNELIIPIDDIYNINGKISDFSITVIFNNALFMFDFINHVFNNEFPFRPPNITIIYDDNILDSEFINTNYLNYQWSPVFSSLMVFIVELFNVLLK